MSTEATSALRRTCLHEYAHLVVAQRLGGCGFVRIARVHTTAGDDRWHGEFHLHAELDARDRCAVALAGTLAEQVADAAHRSPGTLLTLLRSPHALSPADASLAGDFDLHDVERCLALIAAAWTDIEHEAQTRAASVLANFALLSPPPPR